MHVTFFQTVNPERPVYHLTLLIRDQIISSCNLLPPLVSCYALCAMSCTVHSVMQCAQWSNSTELQTLVYSYNMVARPGPVSVGLPGYCTVQTV